MADELGEILFYQTEEGQSRIEVRLEDGTVWLTQTALLRLYQTTKQNVSLHIRNIFRDGELSSSRVVKDSLTTAADGKQYRTSYYNLDVVLAVGYRVRSHRGTQFRQWATKRLSEYLVKGFAMDDERLKRGGADDYFDELLERIRDIRASERLFYRKVLDIYATSVDYDPSAEASKRFFAAVQNKMHWAAHGHTAAEVVYERVDADQPHVGMTHIPASRPIRKADVTVAKNYLSEEEWSTLNLIVNAYLEFAELQARGRRPMYMADWITKLDEFLRISDREILDHAGRISAETEKARAEAEFTRYRELHDADARPVDVDFDRAVAKAKQIEAETKRRPPRSDIE